MNDRRSQYLVKRMQQPITGYHQDETGHWVAQLACGHNQHVRHAPPLESRPWVLSHEGRAGMLGYLLDCQKCADGTSPDEKPD
ncbi:hypothetical protein Enr10x_30030 [Gimesia panareensis]|uniref:Pressure-regulated protein n=1 Tax=Gimesia panareensis TaxID=2527978 RepID=A0A517Q7T1_9PLAN|nr:DUF3565 domain-containing protein [Gimesia panareensis]QDT27685.1 hypothetical protein Enr10x_30030 [Gimesia panareensis]